MTARRAKSQSQLELDAQEFGVGVRCGGWRLGLLVARNVELGQGKRNDIGTSSEVGKVSTTRFAEVAGVSDRTVRFYYHAWNYAAKAGLVPSADKINPGDEDIDIETDSIEVDDNPRTHWTHFYNLAKNPPKEKERPKKEETQEKSEVTPDDVDEDFGIKGEKEKKEFTDEERQEIDSRIKRNQLLEVLESSKSILSRLAKIGEASDDSTREVMSQIASAGLDINSTANALGVLNTIKIDS